MDERSGSLVNGGSNLRPDCVEKHPHFDLWLHTTPALAEAIGQPILSRETIHEWPLSCVQRIALAGEIARIEGDLPVYLDLGGEQRWRAFAATTLDRLAALARDSVFPRLSAHAIGQLREWAHSPPVVQLIDTQAVFTHGDLSGGNIFEDRGELMLVDWQRPCIAPPSVDVARLLFEQGHDPFAHIPREAVQFQLFLMIHWCTECQTKFIPKARYEPHVLDAVERLLL